MKNNKITNLEDFVKAYKNRKSDIEISHMLDISIDQVKNHRKKISSETFKTIKKKS